MTPLKSKEGKGDLICTTKRKEDAQARTSLEGKWIYLKNEKRSDMEPILQFDSREMKKNIAFARVVKISYVLFSAGPAASPAGDCDSYLRFEVITSWK